MSFIVKKIKVILQTNIPEEREVILTNKILYDPDAPSLTTGLSTYPLITETLKYDKSKLVRLSRENQIRFFFDESMFKRTLSGARSSFTGASHDNLSHNVSVMFQILFPTAFPVILNNHVSYDKYIDKTSNIQLSLKGAIPLFKNQFRSLVVPFSYLKIKNKVYTVTGTTILNDIVNHPEYRRLFDEYKTFWELFEVQKLEITKTLNDQKLLLQNTFYHSAPDIDTLITSVKTYQASYQTKQSGHYSHKDIQLIEMLLSALTTIKSWKDTQDQPATNGRIQALVTIHDIVSKTQKLYLDKQIINQFQLLFKIANEIDKLEEIKITYFGDTINTNFYDDNATQQSTMKYFKTKYPEYVKFVATLDQFRSNQRRSSNPVLQNEIDRIGSNAPVYYSELAQKANKGDTEIRGHPIEKRITKGMYMVVGKEVRKIKSFGSVPSPDAKNSTDVETESRTPERIGGSSLDNARRALSTDEPTKSIDDRRSSTDFGEGDVITLYKPLEGIHTKGSQIKYVQTRQDAEQATFFELCDSFTKKKLQGRVDANVGVTRVKENETDFQIYAFVTCLGGEITAKNMDRVGCSFKNEDLGTELRNILKATSQDVDTSTASYYDVSNYLGTERKLKGGEIRSRPTKKKVGGKSNITRKYNRFMR